ncbi:hypothetical protein AeRB84_019605 [Aphanomyces euteiches]|nr:hypothetical protein AeRB84_019605 [Aphanomyces euteiches]
MSFQSIPLMAQAPVMGFSIHDPYPTCHSRVNYNDDSLHDCSYSTRELALSIAGSNICHEDNVDSNTLEDEMEEHNSLELSWRSRLDTFQLMSIGLAKVLYGGSQGVWHLRSLNLWTPPSPKRSHGHAEWLYKRTNPTRHGQS